MKAGIKFELTDDNILSIDSPRNNVCGPHVVVHTDHDERWAIVALEFDGHRTLGIRWFWGSGGTPFTRQSTWFILPEEMHLATINTLCLNPKKRKSVIEYLAGDLWSDDLRKVWYPISAESHA